VHKRIFLVLAIAWTGVILFLCLIKSSDLPQVSIQNLDKVVHAFFHFMFTSLWFLFFRTKINSSTITKALVISFVFSVFFGILIEILQALCTTTRTADVFDVLANITGASLAVILIVWLNKNYGSKFFGDYKN
jgi:VanZ family protein